MKEKAVYEVKEELEAPQNSQVICDQIICFPRLAREGEKAVLFRRVEIWDPEKQESLVFLSNLLAFGATTIVAIYKDRGLRCSAAIWPISNEATETYRASLLPFRFTSLIVDPIVWKSSRISSSNWFPLMLYLGEFHKAEVRGVRAE
jgi:hypothetical protein